MSRATPQFTEAQEAATREIVARYQAHDRVWARQLAEMQVQLDNVQQRHDVLLANHNTLLRDFRTLEGQLVNHNTLLRDFRTLEGHITRWEVHAHQLEAENASLRDASGLPPPRSFPLQNPNNVDRAYTERQHNPRESRIENLVEPDGGLALDPRPPPPPEVLPAGHQVVSRFFRSQARVESAGDGGPAAAGLGHGRKAWEVEVQKAELEKMDVEEEKVKVKEEQVETDKMDVDQVVEKAEEADEPGPAIKQEERE